AHVPSRGAEGGAARGARADRLRALEARPRLSLRAVGGEGGGDAERRRPRLPAERGRGFSLSPGLCPLGRRNPAAQEPARSARRCEGSRAPARRRRPGAAAGETDPPPAAALREAGAELRGYVPTDELARLYRGAACLVQASYYEGFGLPVLEAMASGTPVVTVREEALVEVVGDAAVVV